MSSETESLDANKIEAKDPRASLQEKRNSSGSMYQFRLTDWAQNRVDNKRKRKGLGEIRPRKNNPVKQFFVNTTNVTLGLLLVAPLERVRVV